MLNYSYSNDLLYLLEPKWYEQQTGKQWPDKNDAIKHYLNIGWKQGLDPHPIFSTSFYLTENTDVQTAEIPPLLHFVMHGHVEGRSPHSMFMTQWYRDKYMDLNDTKVNPLIHYLTKGAKSGNRPNPDFDPDWYLRTYCKHSRDATEPLMHYVTVGLRAGNARNEQEENFLIFNGKTNGKLLRSARLDRQFIEKKELLINKFPVTKHELHSIELLSVDVWDTILRRDCHPDEIKLQTSRYVYLKYFWDLRPIFRNVTSLFRRRIQVENDCAPKNDFEYRFSVAAKKWLRDVLDPSISDECCIGLAEEIISQEIRTEIRSTRVDENFSKFIQQRNLPPVIFSSDFYLESKLIAKILEAKGLRSRFVSGYSSCDQYINKRSGDLFKKIIHDFSIDPQSLLHVGDNKHADVAIPITIGLKALHYEQPKERLQQDKFKQAFTQLIDGQLDAHEVFLEDALEELANENAKRPKLESEGIRLSPIVASFVLHVIEQALFFNVKKVYFFSREGQFFQEIYDSIIKHDPYDLGIDTYPKSCLLEVSRVATFSASLTSIEKNELMRLWSQYSQQSLRAFCKSLNIDEGVIASASKMHGVDMDEVIEEPWSDSRFSSVMGDEGVIDSLSQHIVKQRELLTAYLKQQGFFDEAPAAVIVDIGWRGTIHDNICRLTNKHIHGCYLGLFKYLNEQVANSSKDGWLVDYNKHEYCWEHDEVAALEMLFNRPGGSVVGYSKIENKVVANRQIIPGEEIIVKGEIRQLQMGMISGAMVVVNYLRLHGLLSQHLQRLAKIKTKQFLCRPSQDVADTFFKLVHNENFGSGNATEMEIVKEQFQGLDGLYGHKLHAAASELLAVSNWKGGFLSLPLVRSFYDNLSQFDRNSLPLEFGLHYRDPLRGRHSHMPRVSVYAPAPIVGSGGHRTIFNVARRMCDLGIELLIYLESEGEGIHVVEDYLQGTPARVSVGWVTNVPTDFVLATIAHSASVVAQHPCPLKGYLVQDFEAAFNPLSDGYVVAENSYCFGLHHFTIGNWLTHLMRNQYGVSAIPSGLGVDTEIYKPLEHHIRENAVCFLYQPDKPRRAPNLGIKALRIVKMHRPDVKIYVYGSDLPLEEIDFEVENLGLIHDLNSINDLYNKCKVGLCISLSNPSRIPYEMMAAGVVPVDLYRYNNLLDHENGTALLAYQEANSIAEAILSVLNDSDVFTQRSTASIGSANSRTLNWEQDLVVNYLSDILQQRLINDVSCPKIYSEPVFISDKDKSVSSLAFCDWQKKMTSLCTENGSI